jgi:hypothetical protein
MVICCQDCGIIIYWDDKMKEPVDAVDDLSCPPYITESGDLFCCRCGQKYDERQDEEYDEEYDEFYSDTPEKKASKILPNKQRMETKQK